MLGLASLMALQVLYIIERSPLCHRLALLHNSDCLQDPYTSRDSTLAFQPLSVSKLSGNLTRENREAVRMFLCAAGWCRPWEHDNLRGYAHDKARVRVFWCAKARRIASRT